MARTINEIDEEVDALLDHNRELGDELNAAVDGVHENYETDNALIDAERELYRRQDSLEKKQKDSGKVATVATVLAMVGAGVGVSAIIHAANNTSEIQKITPGGTTINNYNNNSSANGIPGNDSPVIEAISNLADMLGNLSGNFSGVTNSLQGLNDRVEGIEANLSGLGTPIIPAKILEDLGRLDNESAKDRVNRTVEYLNGLALQAHNAASNNGPIMSVLETYAGIAQANINAINDAVSLSRGAWSIDENLTGLANLTKKPVSNISAADIVVMNAYVSNLTKLIDTYKTSRIGLDIDKTIIEAQGAANEAIKAIDLVQVSIESLRQYRSALNDNISKTASAIDNLTAYAYEHYEPETAKALVDELLDTKRAAEDRVKELDSLIENASAIKAPKSDALKVNGTSLDDHVESSYYAAQDAVQSANFKMQEWQSYVHKGTLNFIDWVTWYTNLTNEQKSRVLDQGTNGLLTDEDEINSKELAYVNFSIPNTEKGGETYVLDIYLEDGQMIRKKFARDDMNNVIFANLMTSYNVNNQAVFTTIPNPRGTRSERRAYHTQEMFRAELKTRELGPVTTLSEWIVDGLRSIGAKIAGNEYVSRHAQRVVLGAKWRDHKNSLEALTEERARPVW